MKIKVVIVILAVACVGLGIALFATKKQADEQHATDVNSIIEYSNQVVDANEHLKELGQVNLTLVQRPGLQPAAAHLERGAVGAIVQQSGRRQRDAGRYQDHRWPARRRLVTNLNTRITDLEAQNKVLDQQAAALNDKPGAVDRAD